MKTTNQEGDPQAAPQPEILEALFGRCRPEIESLFRRHWVSADEADALLDEALESLLARWDQLDDPAAWLLAALDKAIRCRLLIPAFGDDAPA